MTCDAMSGNICSLNLSRPFHPNCQAVLRMHDGYDHGYYFISTFIKDHIEMHAAALKGEDD